VEEDNTLLYVAGHNIVKYKLDEKEQTFMQGKRYSLGLGMTNFAFQMSLRL